MKRYCFAVIWVVSFFYTLGGIWIQCRYSEASCQEWRNTTWGHEFFYCKCKYTSEQDNWGHIDYCEAVWNSQVNKNVFLIKCIVFCFLITTSSQNDQQLIIASPITAYQKNASGRWSYAIYNCAVPQNISNITANFCFSQIYRLLLKARFSPLRDPWGNALHFSRCAILNGTTKPLRIVCFHVC